MPLTPRPTHPGRAVFAANLRAARKRAGMTQEALALAAGMDRSYYVDTEHGRHSIGLDRILMLSDALGVPPADLFATIPSQGTA